MSLPWHSTVLVLHFQKFQKFTLILKSLWKLHFSTWSDLQCFFQRPWPFFLRSTLQQNYIFCSKIRHNLKPNGWFLTQKFKYYIQLKPDNGFGFGTKIQIDEFPQLATNGFLKMKWLKTTVCICSEPFICSSIFLNTVVGGHCL